MTEISMYKTRPDQPNTEYVSTEEPKLQNLVYDFPGILWSLISCL